MEQGIGGYQISSDRDRLCPRRIWEMLSQNYWARERTLEEVEASILHSECFGVYDRDRQIGFARVVTDYVTVYWLCDVVIDPEYRGQGLGTALVEYVDASRPWKGLGILMSRDAQSLYRRFGYQPDKGTVMLRPSRGPDGTPP